MSDEHEPDLPCTDSNVTGSEPEITIDQEQIKGLCADAYAAYDRRDYRKALRMFYQVWLKLPKPQHSFQESAWVLTGIGDSYFQLGQFSPAIEALRSALCCPNGDKSPFIHLRLGQSLLDIGELATARKSLLTAYKMTGIQVFEQEAPKYFNAIRELV